MVEISLHGDIFIFLLQFYQFLFFRLNFQSIYINKIFPNNQNISLIYESTFLSSTMFFDLKYFSNIVITVNVLLVHFGVYSTVSFLIFCVCEL